ncbi:MAG: DEAD/DEAH box helicase [Proteobacteria bacterium]|nr:DEAD/DEAH box helicase [Pseudomonadota bacterium]
MLPAHLAENIRKQVLYYLLSTFYFKDGKVEKAFTRFIEDPENGLFKGPWIKLQRPFRPGNIDQGLPFDIQVPFHPFRHQTRAWLRLSSLDRNPLPTIVTTGTGSGKTECFLYPILDHCWRAKQAGREGIKAIILYPMNALASDQEKRAARTVWEDPQLKSSGIRIGKYIGHFDAGGYKTGQKEGTLTMGPEHGISDHDTLQNFPPDILLTNYRMLDFLLMRPEDQNLWRFNTNGELKYLVLDELHTYDGAQGADVACLIRRLKERLSIPQGDLCVVGTSATLDNTRLEQDSVGTEEAGKADVEETGQDRLSRFASTLFEEEIPPEAVILEDRLEVDEIVEAEVRDIELPAGEDCIPGDEEDSFAYVHRQVKTWGGPVFEGSAPPDSPEFEAATAEWSVQLGQWLKGLRLFRQLLEIFYLADRNNEDPVHWRELTERLAAVNFDFRGVVKSRDREAILSSFFAQVAQAKERKNGIVFSLVPTQVQLWIRELRRLGRIVHPEPSFGWLDETPLGIKNLPAFQCAECGESGWIGLRDSSTKTLIQSKGVVGFKIKDEPSEIYRAWFDPKNKKSPDLIIICPNPKEDAAAKDIPNQQLTTDDDWYLFPTVPSVRQGKGPCPLTDETTGFPVKIDMETKPDQKGVHFGNQGCPSCGSILGVFFIGSQAATLSSVMIDEMFGSVLNTDPKLLAFTDSVQDASHRAGFFTARTYHFTFRTALQHVIDEAGEEGLPLESTGASLLDWWSRSLPGRPGSVLEAMAALMPPDLQQYEPFVKYRDSGARVDPPERLRKEIEERLTWEAVSEFGLMLTHGRTLESNGASCLGWNESCISNTVNVLIDHLPGVDSMLPAIEEDNFRLWLYGLLSRYRERGALEHPYLQPLARFNYWGKYPFGRVVPGRETFPGRIRYRPRLMSTGPDKNHENVFTHSQGSLSPWHIVWARRALGQTVLSEAAVIDLTHTLLEIGCRTGLFTALHNDGTKTHFAIDSKAAILCNNPILLDCPNPDEPRQRAVQIVRPPVEAKYWDGAPSTLYGNKRGRFKPAEVSQRQRYYQSRYRKGALRRVVAREHTGLLETEKREQLERQFDQGLHADAPNVLTCTSTLEMGIDIGDLSSTMLCSIPPNTASYLQRIGRAGRASGTALIVSVINQRPHDLFFYSRPREMLKGKVSPPGCWLDASAVLTRQYLGFCFDCATKEGELKEIPASGNKLYDDLNRGKGQLSKMLIWIERNEDELRSQFLTRFRDEIQPDTRERFLEETRTDKLRGSLLQVATEHYRVGQDLTNTRKRLEKQLVGVKEDEAEVKGDIEKEIKIVNGRIFDQNLRTTLEILTDSGLLPNYAFPEKGVKFYGAVYNKHNTKGQDHETVKLPRPSAMALRELAPRNSFYTHSRQFEIQQIAMGNVNQPLTETWGICGVCGHMRRKNELDAPGAEVHCPQCGHEGDGKSQLDIGQQKQFIEFSRSEAISYMEHYESLSGDRSDERQQEHYQLIQIFDQTIEAPSGAVGYDGLPFGIEYRASMLLRDINVGYGDQPSSVFFGSERLAPENGFLVCRDCGITVPMNFKPEDVNHRRSCQAKIKNDKKKQKGKTGGSFDWEPVYLYRELKSEAVRLLLPLTDDTDIETLRSCIFLGLRLRFEGDPAYLIVAPQVLDEPESGIKKHYLVLMDAIPGGTGYLKTLYQEKDDQGRAGEGIVDVLEKALVALETCACRRLKQKEEQEDPDGCYQCLRTYHLQYKSDRISRERGIKLLKQLIEGARQRVEKKALSDIDSKSLFGSVLEKKFVDTLRTYVENEKGGDWQETIIKGSRGFRFSILDSEFIWELELQPLLGKPQGVMVESQPDFLLYCNDDRIKPVAIFTDGFEYHCHPHNRLTDDVAKRRAILDSGRYHLWNITWDDLTAETSEHAMICHARVGQWLYKFAGDSQRKKTVPDAKRIVCNGMEQLKAFIDYPQASGWKILSGFTAFFPLQMLIGKREVSLAEFKPVLENWCAGQGMIPLQHNSEGNWIYNDKTALNQDLLAYIKVEDALSGRQTKMMLLARIGDSENEVTGSDFKERWRRFLACLNLYQFSDNLKFWTTFEADSGLVPYIEFEKTDSVSEEWKEVIEEVTSSLQSYIQGLISTDCPIPDVEFYNESIEDDAFAELAWPHLSTPVCLLAGDQESFAGQWQNQGWKVVVVGDLQAKGLQFLIELIK